MRVRLNFLKKSEAMRLLGDRLRDKKMSHDLWIRYFSVWERHTRKRAPKRTEELAKWYCG